MKVDFNPAKTSGLSTDEALQKLASEGYNELPSSKQPHPQEFPRKNSTFAYLGHFQYV